MKNITDKIDKRKQPVPPEVAAERKERAKQTREANKARREAKRQQEDAERQQQQEVKSLVISSLRSVLEDPKSSTRQRLRAAQLLSEYTTK